MDQNKKYAVKAFSAVAGAVAGLAATAAVVTLATPALGALLTGGTMMVAGAMLGFFASKIGLDLHEQGQARKEKRQRDQFEAQAIKHATPFDFV